MDDEQHADGEPDEVEAAPQPAAKKNGGGWIALGVAAVIAVCVIGSAVKGCGGSSGQDDGSASATAGCEELVKDRLKAPSTAEFSGESADGSAGSYTVTGDVDSQNSFGAMLRSHFTCTVHSSGNEWKLDDMEID